MNKYIELQAGTKVPKEKLDVFVTEIEKIMDGALLLDEDTVVLDFDNVGDVWKDVLNLYPTRCIKTTRGAHLYYKRPANKRINNATNARTYIGLQADYKTGFNNKKSLVTVKQNGIMREVLNDTPIDNLPELPVALYPIYSKNTNMYEMDDGDGRNSEIYSHIRMLKDNKVEDSDIGKFANFINTKVFKKPLEQQELMNTIASAVNAESNNNEIDIFIIDKKGNQKLDEKKLAVWSINELDLHYYAGHIHFINEEKTRFFKSDMGYKTLMAEIQKRLAKKGLNITIKQAQESEIVNQIIKLMINGGKMNLTDEIEEKVYPVQFRNGWILNNNKDMLKMSGLFTPFNMNVDYDPSANDENVINFINWFCQEDKDLIGLFEEVLGHILMTEKFPHHIFFFIGNTGANGKSTMLNMIENWTNNLHSTVALEQFEKPENLALLIDKLVNCGDDIKASMIEDSRAMKTITSGNKILCRPLYVNPFEFKPSATLIFTCNEIPFFKDKSGGVARRVVCFPCDAQLEDGKRDMDMDYKLSTDTAKSTLLNLALKGLKRIYDNRGQLTKVDAVTQATEKYLLESDNIAMFFSETDVNAMCDDLANNTFTKLYVIYSEYCKESGYYAVSKKKFSNRLGEFGYETYKGAGNTTRVRLIQK